MDIGETIAPTSEQLDAIDLLTGPRTFSIKAVRGGNAEQPVQIDLAEFPRPWRPGKSMRRVLVACWGADSSVYIGRRVTLFCDPNVKFGGDVVGGTRIAALSHIDKPVKLPLLVTRGKTAVFTVQPLPDAPAAPAQDKPAPPTDEQVAACTDRAVLRGWWQAWPEWRDVIQARVAQLDEEVNR